MFQPGLALCELSPVETTVFVLPALYRSYYHDLFVHHALLGWKILLTFPPMSTIRLIKTDCTIFHLQASQVQRRR